MKGYFIAEMLVLTVSVMTCGDDTQPFKITSKRSDDRVEVKLEKGKVVFDVRSPIGISSVTIERTTEQWPEKVAIQLRLKGLENVRVSTDKIKLEASVSSQSGDTRLWKDGREDSPLNSKSPYWMEIRIIDSDGKPTKVIPLKDGILEMQLPKMLLEGNPKFVQLEWIDFYRN
ncbi:MAG: hypothetical protein ACOVLE_15820 [Pirellula staleyi]